MFEKFWNWKKHPASVFFLVVPLAVVGFGLQVLRAVLELRVNGDPWYSVITLCAVALLMFGLWPIRKQLLQSARQAW